MLRLVWSVGDGKQRRLDLDGVGVITVGRSEEADIVLPDPTITAPLHAQLRIASGGWVLEDLGSKNGTWVTRESLRHPTPAAIRPGDNIHIANQRLTVVDVTGTSTYGDTLELLPKPHLSAAQQRVVTAFRRHADGTSPTVAQVAATVELSKHTVKDHVENISDLLGVRGGRGQLQRLLAEVERLGLP